MGRLSNSHHERFAQELANGKSATEAHELAGYKPDRRAASHLRQRDDILRRVAELQAEDAEMARKATELAAEQLSINREWVMGRLVENANRAMQAVPVTDREGMPTGEFRYDGGVANRALELLGKEIGMFVDRSKVDLNAKISLEQWIELLPS